MTYQQKKEQVRNEAIDWQDWLSENSVSYEGLAIASDYFERQGRRYGLLQEFRENAIC
jgi:hypothetical protein